MHLKIDTISLSIVIPVFNSENTIEKLVKQLIDQLVNDYKLEIVLVNDESKDGSEQACIRLFEQYKSIVKFYSLAKNVGEHNAVMAGLNNITGDYVIIIDDDFQNPVSEVQKLTDYAVSNNYDVVYTYYQKKKHSFFRNLGSKLNDKVANIMLKKPKNLYLSSFKIIKKYIVNEIIKYDLPFPYIDGLILRVTNNIGKIQVSHHERETGKSGYTFIKLVSLWMNMFTNFSILPLRVSILTGFIFAILGFILGLMVIIEKFRNPNLPLGYSSIFVVITFFAGIQLISIGMVGEYLGRVFQSQNKRPQYTIRKIFEDR